MNDETPPCDFETLVLERRFATSPERLFAVMTDAAARRVWNAPSDDVVIEIDACDIRPGGREVARCGPKDNPEFTATADFHVVDGPGRLVLTETLTVGGDMLSLSLVTQEIRPDDMGSHLKVTLQIVSLTGPETLAGYAEGWTGALDNLTRLLTAEMAD